jgi:feruloyl-CoA synthase
MAIYFDSEEVGIGLPMPGMSIKLIPADDRYEIRMRGPMMTPGYVGVQVDDLYDEDRFLRIGDYVDYIVPGDISRGLKFAGRIAEEFKLASGTWVSGGRLRAQLIQAASPFVSDALICGIDKEYVGALMWLNRAAAERALDKALATTAEGLAKDTELRDKILRPLRVHNEQNPGSSRRISRVAFLIEPPSVDGQEISDKGTVNQSVALRRRIADVERLYSNDPDSSVIILE